MFISWADNQDLPIRFHPFDADEGQYQCFDSIVADVQSLDVVGNGRIECVLGSVGLQAFRDPDQEKSSNPGNEYANGSKFEEGVQVSISSVKGLPLSTLRDSFFPKM